MRTFVTLENSNCPWCHNALLGTLRERKGVQGVRSEFSSACLIIEHEDNPDALLALVATAERAVAVAGNGEREMIPVEGHEAEACRAAKDIVEAPPGEGSQPLATMKPDRSSAGDDSSTPRSPSDSISSEEPVCPVCHPGGPDARGGVRVLTRERPTPGPVLRAIRFTLRAYRVAFRLPVAPR